MIREDDFFEKYAKNREKFRQNQKNIYNKSNEKIINNYFDDLLISKKLFQYEDKIY